MNPREMDNIRKAEESLWWYRGQRAILSRFLAPLLRGRNIDNVLDAGCGTGFQCREFERTLGWKTVPVDIEPRGLEHARGLGLTRMCQADLSRLPFRDGTFDAACSLDAIVHLPRGEEQAAFRELARVVRPGGLVVVRVSALDVLRSRHSEFVQERQRFTRTRLTEGLIAAGVEPLRCTYVNSLLLPAAVFKFRVWEPLTGAPPASGVGGTAPWLDRILGDVLRFESGLMARGWTLPLGQTLLFAGSRVS